MKNIILIGLSGCGKTSIGKIISAKLHYGFIDTDHIIEKEYDKIPKLFEKGEEHFRDIESEVLFNLENVVETVISTGGGIILRQENIDFLKNLGTIFFIDRPVKLIYNDIDTKNRPLVKDNKAKLYSLNKERYDKYILAAAYINKNDSNIENAVKKKIETTMQTIES